MTTYYVDATSGNDSNAGTATGAAWKTLTKVNASSFSPGDSVLFKKGETWRGQLIISWNGTAGNVITFGAYGTGTDPAFKGSVLITGWSHYSGNIWRASCTTQPRHIFLNGTLGIKTTSISGCNAARKWFWYGSSLYVYSTSDPDSAYVSPGIEAGRYPTTRTSGIVHMYGKRYITIDSIDALHSNSFGIYIQPSSSNITISNCVAGWSYDGGLVASRGASSTSDNLTCTGCAVHHNNTGVIGTGTPGVFNSYNGTPGVDSYHEGLTVEGVNTFTIGTCDVYGNYMEGVNLKQGASNGVVEHCTLHANARINQYIEGCSSTEIRYNRIYDCSWNAGVHFGIETSTYHNDSVTVHHNLIYNNNDGVSWWAMGGVTGQHRNIRVEHNSFYGNYCDIHWKSGATDNYSGTNYIRNNILWPGQTYWRGIWDETSGDQGIHRTTIAYNAFRSGIVTDTRGSNYITLSSVPYTNPTGLTFTLAAGTPCIDAALNLGYTLDFAGNLIPETDPDIGAYEYDSAAPPAGNYVLSLMATNGSITPSPDLPEYTSGTVVTLTATADAGYTFNGWSGSLTGTTNPTTVTMTANKSITANFIATGTATYTLATTAVNGTVTPDPDLSGYESGESVLLTATADSGYEFTGWSGDASGTTNPVTITMDGNKSVTASFESTATTYTLTTSVTGDGSIAASPSRAYYFPGETVTLTATGDTSHTYTPLPITRDPIRAGVNLEIDSCKVYLAGISGDLVTYLQNNNLDGAEVTIKRIIRGSVYSSTNEWTVFQGHADVEFNRSVLVLDLKPWIDSLNIQVPRCTYQESCMWSLFDEFCGLSRASYAHEGTASDGTQMVLWDDSFTAPSAPPYYAGGEIWLRSGNNNGQRRPIATCAGSSIEFLWPLPAEVVDGDSYTIYPGCDGRVVETCHSWYDNANSWRGYLYVPRIEEAML